MARFQLTPEEYRRLHHIRSEASWKRYVVWAISLIALLGGILMGQYLFAALWGAILIFIYIAFYRFGPKLDAVRIASPFALGPFDLELRPESYTVRVGASTLDLHLSEFGRIHDWGEHYRLDHESGCSVYVPKHALTAEEIGIVEAYKARFPGYPQKRYPWD